MGSRSDDDYWNVKYAEASCYDHGDSDMWYDEVTGEWICNECEEEDDG